MVIRTFSLVLINKGVDHIRKLTEWKKKPKQVRSQKRVRIDLIGKNLLSDKKGRESLILVSTKLPYYYGSTKPRRPEIRSKGR